MDTQVGTVADGHRTREDDDWCVLSWHGDVDLAAEARCREGLDAVLRRRPRHLLIDLRDVSFLDATGLALLARAVRARRRGLLDVRLLQPRPQVAAVLHLTGLGVVLPVLAEHELPAGARRLVTPVER